MELTRKDIEGYQAVVKKALGEDITYAEAEEQMYRLMNCMEMMMK